MVLIEELLECDDCNSRVSQAVDDEQIGLLAGGGEVELFCKVCRNITSWRYQHTKLNGPRLPFFTEPLLETFEPPQPKPLENFPPDPLLVGFEDLLKGSDLSTRKRRFEWEWYG